MQILKMANTNMTIFGYLGSETPQSFGAQIYLYPIMQVLAPDIDTCSFEDRQQTAVPLERCDLQTLKRNNNGR